MTTIDSVLRTYGNGLAADDFAEELERVLRQRAVPDPRALSEQDKQALLDVGVPVADFAPKAGRGVVVAAADLLMEHSLALSPTDMAARLNRSVNRVRGAIADGSLYGVKVGRNWLLPTWQVTDNAGPLPHLRKIIAAIPEGASAVSVQRLMTEPSDELFLAGGPVSPRQWLLAGQDADPVVEMVEQLYSW